MNTQPETTAQTQPKKKQTDNSQLEEGQVVKPIQPNVDTRFKTEDVTNTKGYQFSDFDLGKEVQLVSSTFKNKLSTAILQLAQNSRTELLAYICV